MNEWLDNFQMMGVKLNEGEKTLMRFAMKKKQEEIIKLLESLYCGKHEPNEKCNLYPNYETCYVIDDAIALINGENK